MRISTNYQHSIHAQDIANASERVFRHSREVSTGIRLHDPSDDPFATAMVLGLKTSLANNLQYQNNIAVVQTRLKASEAALSELTDIVNDVRQMTVAAANGALEQSAREAYAIRIARLQERLVAIGNRELVSGQYLFAGKAVTTKPFTVNSGSLEYAGSTESMDVDIRPGYRIQGSLVGTPLFTDIYSVLETIRTDMASGDVSKLGNEDLQALDAVSGNLLRQRGDLGSLLQQVDATRRQLESQKDELTALIADYREVDMTEAIAAYKSAQNAYEAALAVAAASMRLSLLDYIRR